MMIDRFTSNDPDTVHRACEAMRHEQPFTAIVERPDLGHRKEEWSGYVRSVASVPGGHRIEMERHDDDPDWRAKPVQS